MLVTITTAYPLSKPELRGRKLILLLYIFSMLFYGGMVPAFMVVKTLGILDTYAALILPFVIVQFNMLVVKNYIEGLPESIEESAKLDGAGYFTILFKVILPMSLPVIATVTLLYAVNYWNNYFHALMYLESSMKTLLSFMIRYTPRMILLKTHGDGSGACFNRRVAFCCCCAFNYSDYPVLSFCSAVLRSWDNNWIG